MKPHYKLEIFYSAPDVIGVVNATYIRGWGEPSPHRRYRTFYMFDGQSACVTVFSDDEIFSRQTCLDVATKFVAGGYRFLSVDLDTMDFCENNGLDIRP